MESKKALEKQDLAGQVEYYNERWKTTDYANLYCLERSIFFLNSLLEAAMAQPARICDLGCGTGWLSSILSSFGPCTGVELAPEAVVLARRKYPQVEFIAADATMWSPAHGSFDIVVSQEVIEHIVDKSAYLAVAHRALRSGGYLFMTTPNLKILDSIPDEEKKRVWEIQPVELPLYRSQLNIMLETAGFEVVSRSSAIDGMGRNGIYRIANSPKLRAVLRSLGLEPWWRRMLLRNDFGMYMTVAARKR